MVTTRLALLPTVAGQYRSGGRAARSSSPQNQAPSREAGNQVVDREAFEGPEPTPKTTTCNRTARKSVGILPRPKRRRVARPDRRRAARHRHPWWQRRSLTSASPVHKRSFVRRPAPLLRRPRRGRPQPVSRINVAGGSGPTVLRRSARGRLDRIRARLHGRAGTRVSSRRARGLGRPT